MKHGIIKLQDSETSITEGKSTALNTTANTHSEVGILLEVLTAPVAIIGFTNDTYAAAQTELGLENGAGRVWTYTSTNAPSKTTQGNAYVWSPAATADAYLSTPDTADMSFGDGSNDSVMSVGGWIEVVNTGGSQRIISKSTGTSATSEWALSLGPTETLWLICYDASAGKLCYRNTNTPLSVGLHFVTVTKDATGGATAMDATVIYVDGVAVASTATNDDNYVAMENLAVVPQIGRDTSGSYFAGDLGRLFVTPEELTAAKVWQLFEKTRGYYNK